MDDYTTRCIEPATTHVVADADDTLRRMIALAERGARAEADRALLAAAEGLRHGRTLDELAERLHSAAAAVALLAAEVARVRAAMSGVDLGQMRDAA